ncbi:unnamed protein product, partial [Ilex paraguariensis]
MEKENLGGSKNTILLGVDLISPDQVEEGVFPAIQTEMSGLDSRHDNQSGSQSVFKQLRQG